MPPLPWGGRQAQPNLVQFTFYLSLPFYLYSLQVKRQLPLQDSEWLFPRQQASGEQPEALTGNFNHLNGKCDTRAHSHTGGGSGFWSLYNFSTIAREGGIYRWSVLNQVLCQAPHMFSHSVYQPIFRNRPSYHLLNTYYMPDIISLSIYTNPVR